eukprot:COSAG01_NODE_64434_length_276_cov_1.045198_1_plen_75_part_01
MQARFRSERRAWASRPTEKEQLDILCYSLVRMTKLCGELATRTAPWDPMYVVSMATNRKELSGKFMLYDTDYANA